MAVVEVEAKDALRVLRHFEAAVRALDVPIVVPAMQVGIDLKDLVEAIPVVSVSRQRAQRPVLQVAGDDVALATRGLTAFLKGCQASGTM
jgi:hypothetical protein